MSLKNKRIVVVGGGSGMGLATAADLAAAGANVVWLAWLAWLADPQRSWKKRGDRSRNR
jgi:NAD(P)-dependent dehydrogenase (short-subunit alcohol dehydrogenase family)